MLVAASLLRKEIAQDKRFEKNEVFKILRKTWHAMIGLKPPDLQYIILNAFDGLQRQFFFQPQEILFGKSFCDISLSDPESVSAALASFKDGATDR